MPTQFKVGVAMSAYQRGIHSLDAVGEFAHPADNTEHVNFGGEYAFNQFFYLRGGYHVQYDAHGAAGGFGLRIDTTQTSDLNFDYSWTDLGFLGDAHRLSVGFSYERRWVLRNSRLGLALKRAPHWVPFFLR